MLRMSDYWLDRVAPFQSPAQRPCQPAVTAIDNTVFGSRSGQADASFLFCCGVRCEIVHEHSVVQQAIVEQLPHPCGRGIAPVAL